MKTSQLKMIIREVVREEIRLGLKEIVGELNTSSPQTENVKPVSKNYSKNSVLNEVLNETAQGEDWKTMGGKTFTSDNMSDILTKNTDVDNSNGNLAAEMGINPNEAPSFLKKDYRAIMKKVKEKDGK